MSEQSLLMVVASPSVEETLVDWLLENTDISGFSTHRIDGHGSRQAELSLAEQVVGRQRKVMFHVHGDLPVIEALTGELKDRFRGAGLHYWLTPVLDAGRI